MLFRKRWMVTLVLAGGILMSASGLLAEEANLASEKAKVAQLREKLVTMSRDDTLSPLFNTVAEAVQPSVVVICVTKKVKMNGSTFLFPGFDKLPPDVEQDSARASGKTGISASTARAAA